MALLWTGFRSEESALTLDNFRQVLGSTTYMSLLWRTLGIALLVTLLAIALGWPAAWALARYTRPRLRSLLLALVIIPYLTSQLLLIYEFITLIQAGGPLMSLLEGLGVADAQDSMMYSPAATLTMLVYESLPTAVLVMYAASAQIDGSLLEAARSLGAGRLRVFAQVIWPLSAGMAVANFALTYVQTVGAFAEPGVLGGPRGQMFGNAIADQLRSGSNAQFAIALSLMLLVTSLVVVGLVAGVVAVSRMTRRTTDLPTASVATQPTRIWRRRFSP
jgi:ABC-type spermidine/putrescine transport system permease subunit I